MSLLYLYIVFLLIIIRFFPWAKLLLSKLFISISLLSFFLSFFFLSSEGLLIISGGS